MVIVGVTAAITASKQQCCRHQNDQLFFLMTFFVKHGRPFGKDFVLVFPLLNAAMIKAESDEVETMLLFYFVFKDSQTFCWIKNTTTAQEQNLSRERKNDDWKYEKEMGRRSMATYLDAWPKGMCSAGDRTIALEQDWSDLSEQEQFLFTLLIFPIPLYSPLPPESIFLFYVLIRFFIVPFLYVFDVFSNSAELPPLPLRWWTNLFDFIAYNFHISILST